ncbi:MAG: DSBA oxidoreductase [Hydrogenibacillus schlegelii]|uniref:DSBA oxidoreductase n=1 Tax=Hydrogenibacillus schlegelii TaxID=1484 RepID=A0A2T5GBX1_HYDSH|nr:DsbA family protein [Hydrogenibacillus schlegelii]PTQ53693.1 MAG: DSBA oxidoreductase [Hydrogenibacillus schlegelii]
MQGLAKTARPEIELEFFHDVLCAWCYALSPRVRRLAAEYPEIRIVHRAFALAPTPESLETMFGSKEQAKREILSHWRAANQNDDDHRIDAALMATRPFDYPYSMPGLLACKAAERQGGQEAHWALYDRIQRAHLTECLNIADFAVLRRCAEDVGLDVARWEGDVRSPETREAVERDLARARLYGIRGVPTLVAERKYALSGAQPYERLKSWIERLLAQHGTSRID